MMEPYRPFVDDEVLAYIKENPDQNEITTDFKKRMLNILTQDVLIGKVTRPFMLALTMTSASLAKIFAGDEKSLSLLEIKPQLPQPAKKTFLVKNYSTFFSISILRYVFTICSVYSQCG